MSAEMQAQAEAQKTVEQIRAEWAAIEAKRPGGSLPNVLKVLEADSRSPVERSLIQIIEVLHDSLQNYHAEMGVLLAALTTQEASHDD